MMGSGNSNTILCPACFRTVGYHSDGTMFTHLLPGGRRDDNGLLASCMGSQRKPGDVFHEMQGQLDLLKEMTQ